MAMCARLFVAEIRWFCFRRRAPGLSLLLAWSLRLVIFLSHRAVFRALTSPPPAPTAQRSAALSDAALHRGRTEQRAAQDQASSRVLTFVILSARTQVHLARRHRRRCH